MSIPYDVGPDSFPSGKPFRNVFSRNRSESCDHRWLRLPIVSLSVTYRCEACQLDVTLSWGYLGGGGPVDLDRAFQAQYGGTVTGPVPEPMDPQARNVKLTELVRLLVDPNAASDRITVLRGELGI